MDSTEINPLETIKSEDRCDEGTLTLHHITKHEMRSICFGCLGTGGRMLDLQEHSLETVYKELIGLPVYNGQLCHYCVHLLRKFLAFRTSCRNASLKLQQGLKILHEDNDSYNHSSLNLARMQVLTLHYDPSSCDSGDENVWQSEVVLNCVTTTFTDTHRDGPHTQTTHTEREPQNKKQENEILDDIDNNDSGHDDFDWPLEEDNLKLKPNQPTKTQTKIIETLETEVKKSSNKRKRKRKSSEELNEEVKSSKNVKRKSKKKPEAVEEGKEMGPEEKHHQLLHETSKLFNTMCSQVKNKGGDHYEMFERIYQESLVYNPHWDPNLDKKVDRQVPTKHTIWKFLTLHKRIESLHDTVQIEFLSVRQQLRDMEEARAKGAEPGHCDMCFKKFRHKDTRDRHMESAHKKSFAYSCKICLYRLKTPQRALSHVLSAHVQRARCARCRLAFVRRHWSVLAEHRQSHEGVKAICKFCGATFKANTNLAMHIRQRHRNEMDAIVCRICGDSYNGPNGLRLHIKFSHGEAVTCESCGVLFADKDVLAAHTNYGCDTHNSSWCALCGAGFPTEQLLKEHSTEQHAKNTCTKCHKSFADERSYRSHRFHSSCGRQRKELGYPSGSGLEGQPRNKKLVLMCEQCGQTGFGCEAKLRYHQRRHTGERPYTCELCPKTFRTHSAKWIHRAHHTGERRYQCSYCPKAFKQIAHLTAHIPMHTKEKAYSCDVCQKNFAHRTTMLEHKRTIHEGLPPKYKKPKIKQ